MSDTATRTRTSGKLRAERGQDVREKVLAGDGAGREHEFAGDLVGCAGHRPAGLGGEVEDAAGVVVEPPAGGGERHASPLAAEEGCAQVGFELLDALADGGLGDAELAARRR